MLRPSTAKLLITFRAAAQHLSFVRAAAQLNVQPPAVSRQISELEDELGTLLFLRTKPRLTLTEDGCALRDAVNEGFAVIERATSHHSAAFRRTRLVVHCTIGFANCFLLPRLGAFETRYPDIAIDLVTRDQNEIFDEPPADVAVTFGSEGLPFASFRKIFGEVMFATGAPRYLGQGCMLTLDELAGEKLLVLTSTEHGSDWEHFLGPDLAEKCALRRHAHFNSYAVYLQAALDGHGIAIGWQHLLDDLVDAGALRIACDHRCETNRGYFANVMPRARDRDAAVLFQTWLAEAGASSRTFHGTSHGTRPEPADLSEIEL